MKKKSSVQSHYNYSRNVGERKRSERDYLIVLDKVGNELFPTQKVVPNKALKVKDVMDRYIKGLPVHGTTSRPVWPGEDMNHDSPDMFKLQRMDTLDRKDLARSTRQRVPKKEEPEVPKNTPES